MFLYLYGNITFVMGALVCIRYEKTFLLAYLAVTVPLKCKHKILKLPPSKLMDSLTEIKLVFCEEINNLTASKILPCLSCFCFSCSERKAGPLLNVVCHPRAWLRTHL